MTTPCAAPRPPQQSPRVRERHPNDPFQTIRIPFSQPAVHAAVAIIPRVPPASFGSSARQLVIGSHAPPRPPASTLFLFRAPALCFLFARRTPGRRSSTCPFAMWSGTCHFFVLLALVRRRLVWSFLCDLGRDEHVQAFCSLVERLPGSWAHFGRKGPRAPAGEATTSCVVVCVFCGMCVCLVCVWLMCGFLVCVFCLCGLCLWFAVCLCGLCVVCRVCHGGVVVVVVVRWWCVCILEAYIKSPCLNV